MAAGRRRDLGMQVEYSTCTCRYLHVHFWVGDGSSVRLFRRPLQGLIVEVFFFTVQDSNSAGKRKLLGGFVPHVSKFSK